MKCPNCSSDKNEKVSFLDNKWFPGAQRCLDCLTIEDETRFVFRAEVNNRVIRRPKPST